MSGPDLKVVDGADAMAEPRRVMVVQEDERALVDVYDEDMVMTFPHLVVRELIVLVSLTLFLVGVSLAFDAPLEQLADPERTPNPAKAPWYFLGLQELLHYYPPVVSGVLLPLSVVAALVVIPYFRINLERPPLWSARRGRKLAVAALVLVLLCTFFYLSGNEPVWPLIGPTAAVGVLLLAPGVVGPKGAVLEWLGRRSLPFWIFLWFVVAVVTLTVVGVFFRGPGWSLTFPWADGVFY